MYVAQRRTLPLVACRPNEGLGIWDSLAAREWVRMKETEGTDPEDSSVSVRVGLMDDFFQDIRGQCKACI